MSESQASNVLPKLATVKNLPSCFPLLELTAAAIHGQIFKAEDRFDSKGRKIPGNGLAATGAIIRRGRKVLIDVDKYAGWLAGETVKPEEQKIETINLPESNTRPPKIPQPHKKSSVATSGGSK